MVEGSPECLPQQNMLNHPPTAPTEISWPPSQATLCPSITSLGTRKGGRGRAVLSQETKPLKALPPRLQILCQEETNTDTSSILPPPRELLSSRCDSLEMNGCYGLETGPQGGDVRSALQHHHGQSCCSVSQVKVSPPTSHLVGIFLRHQQIVHHHP